MNLTKISKILDGTETDARHKAIKLLVSEGLSVDQSRKFIDYLNRTFPNLKGSIRKFYPGIVRFILNDEIDIENKSSISRFNSLLRVFQKHPAFDYYDKDFNGDSLESVKKALNLQDEIYHVPDNVSYEIVKIPTFKDAVKWRKYASNWCILQSEDSFNEHTIDGTNQFVFLVRSDFREVPATPGEEYPYDDYGYSLIAVSIDPDGNLASCTSRWNFDDYHDDFLNQREVENLINEQLKDLL